MIPKHPVFTEYADEYQITANDLFSFQDPFVVALLKPVKSMNDDFMQKTVIGMKIKFFVMKPYSMVHTVSLTV